MASDGQVLIDLLFPANKQEFHTDVDWASNLIKRFGTGAGEQMDEDFKKNASSVKSEAKKVQADADSETDKIGKNAGEDMKDNFKKNANGMKNESNDTKNKVNKDLDGIKKEVRTKLIASAENAGIKNFRSLLDKLPKKEVTNLEAKIKKGEVIDWQEAMAKMPRQVVTKMKLDDKEATAGLSRLKADAENTGNHFKHLKEIIVGSFVGSAIQNGFSSIVNGFKEETKAGIEYNKTLQVSQASWTTLTDSAVQGKKMTNMATELANHFGQARDMVDELDQQFYHVLDDSGKTKTLTTSFLTLADTIGLSSAQTQALGQDFTHTMTSGKLQLGDFNQVANYLPMFGENLLKYERKIQNNSKLTMKQLQAEMSAGKISATDAMNVINQLGDKYKSSADNMMNTLPGMERAISAKAPQLFSAFISPFLKAENPIAKVVMKWVNDPKTETELSSAGGRFSKALNGISASIVAALPEIKDIIVNVVKLSGIIGGTIWHMFADIIYDIANMFGLVSSKSGKAVNPLKEIDKVFQALVDHKQGVEMVTRALVAMFAIKKITDFIGETKTAIKTLEELSLVQKLTSLVPGAGKAGTAEKVVAGGEDLAGTALSRTAANSIGRTSLIGTKSLFKGSASMLGLGKSIPLLSAGTGVATELMSNNSTGEKIGGSTGSVAGTAAGAVIGSMILPGIGTAIGGATGSALGKKLGEVIGKGAEDHFKGHPIKANVKVKTTAADVDSSKISKALQPSLKKLDKQLMLKINTDPASISKAKTQTDKLYSGMSKSINSYYKNKEAKSKKDLDSLVKQGVITQAQENKRLSAQHAADEKARVAKQKSLSQMQSDTNKYYAKVQNIENGGTKKLEQIAQKYGKNSQKYENEKNKELEKAHKTFTTKYVKDEYSMNTSIEKDIQKGAKQQESIYDQLIKNKGKLSASDLKATQKHADDLYNTSVKAAKETRSDVESEAQKKYQNTVDTARREWKDNGSISHSQYKDIVKNAQDQEDDTDKATKSQYDKVTKKATDQHNKVTKEINQQKDDVTNAANNQAHNHAVASDTEMADVGGNYTAGFKAAGKIWHGFTKWIGKVLKVFDDSKEFPDQPSNFQAYAKGSTGISNDQVALVGEEGFELGKDASGFHVLGAQGPEIRSLRAGTSILTHEQSIGFLRKIGLPGYAKGTEDDDTSFMSEIFEVVTNSAGKLWSWIKDKTGIDGLLDSLTSKGLVKDAGKGSFNIAKDSIVKMLTKLGESSAANPGGSGVTRWTPFVMRALAMNGLSTSAAMVAKVLSQINTESSGDPHAKQKGADPDGDGSGPAMGLMQTKRSTFTSNAFPGHGDIWNGFDSLLAGLHYAKKRYGASLSFLGKGHGYAAGGDVDEDGLYRLAEGNNKEFVVPNPNVAGVDRTYAMIGKSAAYVAAKQGLQTVNNQSVNMTDYSDKLNKITSKLEVIAQKQLRLDGSSFSKVYESYGSARRVQRTQHAQRGLAINVNI